MPPSGDVAVVIPAKNESDRIQETVTGATVVQHSRSHGKAAAMETGAETIRLVETTTAPGGAGPARHLLFLDGDLGATAAEAGPLIEPVRAGDADMTIAVFADRARQGGHGFVVGLSGAGIERATGWRPAQPLNGQRCLTRAAFEAARPLAHGFGVETALTIDLLRRGMRVREVEVPLAHRATGTDWRAQVHRARQFADVARALAVRQVAGRGPTTRGSGPRSRAPESNGGTKASNGRGPALGRG